MNLYISLVSSLPLLRMTEAPLVSYGKFMSDCEGLLDGKHLDMLRRFSLVPGLRPGEKPQDAATDDPDALEAFIAELRLRWASESASASSASSAWSRRRVTLASSK